MCAIFDLDAWITSGPGVMLEGGGASGVFWDMASSKGIFFWWWRSKYWQAALPPAWWGTESQEESLTGRGRLLAPAEQAPPCHVTQVPVGHGHSSRNQQALWCELKYVPVARQR